MNDTTLQVSRDLVASLADVRLAPAVAYIYRPLEYAWAPHAAYLERYGSLAPREVLLVGMNPGPWGMGQTGVPFGCVPFVRDWMGIEGPVSKPGRMHPSRPVEGFACERVEVSGSRVWGWARERFGTPDRFFARFFVWNYCPLLLYGADGRNVTPDKLTADPRDKVEPACDRALRRIIDILEPRHLVGVGVFAESRLRAVMGKDDARIGRILHPSPASPQANIGWAEQVESELASMGVGL